MPQADLELDNVSLQYSHEILLSYSQITNYNDYLEEGNNSVSKGLYFIQYLIILVGVHDENNGQ